VPWGRWVPLELHGHGSGLRWQRGQSCHPAACISCNCKCSICLKNPECHWLIIAWLWHLQLALLPTAPQCWCVPWERCYPAVRWERGALRDGCTWAGRFCSFWRACAWRLEGAALPWWIQWVLQTAHKSRVTWRGRHCISSSPWAASWGLHKRAAKRRLFLNLVSFPFIFFSFNFSFFFFSSTFSFFFLLALSISTSILVRGMRTKGNGFELKEGRFRSDVRRKFFTDRPYPVGMAGWFGCIVSHLRSVHTLLVLLMKPLEHIATTMRTCMAPLCNQCYFLGNSTPDHCETLELIRNFASLQLTGEEEGQKYYLKRGRG